MRRREQGGQVFELHVDDLVIPRGSFVAIVGKSGCGKSTLLDMLGLVLKPTQARAFAFGAGASGSADVWAMWEEGREVDLARLRRDHIGYVLQTGGLFPFLSVRANARLPAELKGNHLSDELLEERAARLEIKDLLSKKPGFLSGGQRQRSAILRALSNDPDIILADEPTAAVDQETAVKIVADLKALAEQKDVTVLVVTHDRELVANLATLTYTFTVQKPQVNLTVSRCHELRAA